MTTHTKLRRKDARFVKIAQISDLHFSGATQFLDQVDPDTFLTKIADDLKKQQPDILCVTGDIVDGAWLESVKRRASGIFQRVTGATERNTRQSLYDTLLKARKFFEELCERVSIKAETALFVIPGNHDYRIQGFFKQTKQAESTFREVFKPYFRNAHLLFEADDSEPIAVTVVSIDSNGSDLIAALASGAITGPEFQKFKVFDECKQVFAEAGHGPIRVFRVCLLHHHPLPVVPAENYRNLSDNPGLADKTKRIFEILTGPQTTLLKNAGGFLSSALAAQVDLVLHGHEHKAWISELRYPSTDGLHRLLVGAAGSAGVETGQSYTYNVATLYEDAGINLGQRKLERNLPGYEDGKRYSAPTPNELRESRYRKAADLLRDQPIKSAVYSAAKLAHGALCADKMARVTRLQATGNADVTRSFENLEAATSKRVRYLPLVSRSPGGYQGVGARPTIRMTEVPGGRHYNIELKRDDTATGDWTAWILEFDPPLEQGYPVTFEVTYLLCNGYEYVTEYRRARQAPVETKAHAPDGCEAVANRARVIYLKRLSETIIFPQGWTPPKPPLVRVYDSNGTAERFEQDYCAKWLQYVEGASITSLTVDLPLPDLTYELSWSLVSKSDYESQRYDSFALSQRRAFAYDACSDERKRQLKNVLDELHHEISVKLPGQAVPLANDRTELGIFIVQFEDGGSEDRPSVRTWLKCCAHRADPKSNGVFSDSFHVGVGLAGQAYRSESVLFDVSEGRSGLYKMGEGQTKPHSFLCAVPLAVPANSGAGENKKKPIYAILCLGSYVTGSGLEVLQNRSPIGKTTREWALDLITGHFNGKFFDALTS